MTASEAQNLKREVKEAVESLSGERLRSVRDFVRYVEQLESDEATAELMRIPGISEAVERAEKELAAGRGTPVEQLKRKY